MVNLLSCSLRTTQHFLLYSRANGLDPLFQKRIILIFFRKSWTRIFSYTLIQVWYLPFLKAFSLPIYSLERTDLSGFLYSIGFYVLYFLVLLGMISIGRYVLKILGIIVVSFIILYKGFILCLCSLCNIFYCLLLYLWLSEKYLSKRKNNSKNNLFGTIFDREKATLFLITT